MCTAHSCHRWNRLPLLHTWHRRIRTSALWCYRSRGSRKRRLGTSAFPRTRWRWFRTRCSHTWSLACSMLPWRCRHRWRWDISFDRTGTCPSRTIQWYCCTRRFWYFRSHRPCPRKCHRSDTDPACTRRRRRCTRCPRRTRNQSCLHTRHRGYHRASNAGWPINEDKGTMFIFAKGFSLLTYNTHQFP